MKKIVLSVALMFCTVYLMAQEETAVQLYYSTKKYDKAKEEVDKWVADPKLKDKDKPNAYLWKLLVYSSLYADSTLTNQYTDANAQALDAFEKYKASDPSLKAMKDGHFEAGIGNLYSSSFNNGRTAFQNKEWDKAYTYFAESEMLGNFLLTNKLSSSTSTLDTATVLFTAYAAQNSKDLIRQLYIIQDLPMQRFRGRIMKTFINFSWSIIQKKRMMLILKSI